MFKICTQCINCPTKPLSLKKRVCPVCGIRGLGAFRSPTEQEVQTEMARRVKAEAFLQQLLKEEG